MLVAVVSVGACERPNSSADVMTGTAETAVTLTACDLPALGPADVTVIGDMRVAQSDIQGTLVVGGSASLRDYSLGEASSIDPTTPLLAVCGDLDFENGTARGGAVVVGGRVTVASVDMQAVESRCAWSGDALASLAQSGAQTLDVLPANGHVEAEAHDGKWAMRLQGDDPGLNVFEVEAEQLSRADSVSLQLPEQAAALLRVVGDSLVLEDHAWFDARDQRGRLVLHCPRASEVVLRRVALEGDVFAPFARAVVENGALTGRLFVKELSGNGQINRPVSATCADESGASSNQSSGNASANGACSEAGGGTTGSNSSGGGSGSEESGGTNGDNASNHSTSSNGSSAGSGSNSSNESGDDL